MAQKIPWHESDEFWKIVGDVLFARSRIEEAGEHVDKIIKLLNLNPEMKVLDLCCGVGRHSIELAKRGYNVSGVDRTESYLEKAKKRAGSEGVSIDFAKEDARIFRRDNSYNLVMNLFTSFGFFGDQEDDRRVAENVYNSLKPGGIFLMELNSKDIILRDFSPRGWNRIDDIYILEEREFVDSCAGMKMKWIIIKDEKFNEVELTLRLYSATELRSLLISCGFGKIEIYGDLDGNPYDHKAKRLVVAAYK